MISEQQTSDLFSPIKNDLVKIILESWNKIHASELNFKSRSRASLMWDETFYKANLVWCDSEYVENIEEKTSQTAHYWLNNKTFFRIKKGNDEGYTRNYPTQSALKFHEIQSDMFGDASRLEVTYVLNSDETEIKDIAVVHRKGNEIDFRFSLLDIENVTQLKGKTNPQKLDVQKGVTKLKPGLIKNNKDKNNNE